LRETLLRHADLAASGIPAPTVPKSELKKPAKGVKGGTGHFRPLYHLHRLSRRRPMKLSAWNLAEC